MAALQAALGTSVLLCFLVGLAICTPNCAASYWHALLPLPLLPLGFALLVLALPPPASAAALQLFPRWLAAAGDGL